MTLIPIRRRLLAVFTGLRGFFIGVRSITLLLEHMFVVFLFLGGEWSDTFNFLSAQSSIGILKHACLACPWCSLARFLSALRALPCALYWLSPSSGWSYFPGELHGLANRLVRAFLFGTGWFRGCFLRINIPIVVIVSLLNTGWRQFHYSCYERCIYLSPCLRMCSY